VDYLDKILSNFGMKPLYFGNETQPYYEHFKTADFAICYRLHMAISCVGWGVPFRLINFDLRTEAFKGVYDIDPVTYDAFGLGEMRRLLRDVVFPPSGSETLSTIYKNVERRREELRAKTAQFFDDVAAKTQSKA
jgi:hypothetical protein